MEHEGPARRRRGSRGDRRSDDHREEPQVPEAHGLGIGTGEKKPGFQGRSRASRRAHLISLSRSLRYSICPRSASSPIGPVAGTFIFSSNSSPLQVQCATSPFTTTTISFQSWGLYFLS